MGVIKQPVPLARDGLGVYKPNSVPVLSTEGGYKISDSYLSVIAITRNL